MKLKQKFAMALATTIITTSVPVTTFAESTDISPATISLVEGDTVGYDVPYTEIFDKVYYLNTNNTEEENKAIREAAKKLGDQTYFDRNGNEFVKYDTYKDILEGEGDTSGDTNVDSDNFRNLTNKEAEEVIRINTIYGSAKGNLAGKEEGRMYLDDDINPYKVTDENGKTVGTYVENPGLKFGDATDAQTLDLTDDDGRNAGYYLNRIDEDVWQDRGIYDRDLDDVNSKNLDAELVIMGHGPSTISLTPDDDLTDQGIVVFDKDYKGEGLEDLVVYVIKDENGIHSTSKAEFAANKPYYIGEYYNKETEEVNTSFFAVTDTFGVDQDELDTDDFEQLKHIDDLRKYTNDSKVAFEKSDNSDMEESSEAFLVKNTAHDFFIHAFKGFLDYYYEEEVLTAKSDEVDDLIAIAEDSELTAEDLVDEINELRFTTTGDFDGGEYVAYVPVTHESGIRYYQGLNNAGEIEDFLDENAIETGKSNAKITVGLPSGSTDWGPSDEIYVVLTEEKDDHIVGEVMNLEDAQELFGETGTDEDSPSIKVTEDHFEDDYEEDVKPSSYEFNDPYNAQTLMINVDLGLDSRDRVEVYIDADDVEFIEDVYRAYGATAEEFDEDSMTMVIKNQKANEGGTIEIEWSDETTLKLTLIGDNEDTPDDFYMPLMYEVQDGTPKLEISGTNEIEEGEYNLTKGEVGTEELEVSIESVSIVSTEGEGELGAFEIEEITRGSLNDRVIKIELESSDVEFVNQEASDSIGLYDDREFKVDGSRGYSSTIKKGTEADHVQFILDGDNPSIGYLVFEDLNASAAGNIEIEGLEIISSDGDLRTGEIEVTISLVKQEAGDKSDDDLDTFWGIYDEYKNDDIEGQLDYDDDRLKEITDIIAEIRDHALNISVDEKIETVGGRSDNEYEVTVTITDHTAEYLRDEGKVELTLEGAIFAASSNKDEDSYYTTIDGDYIEDKTKIEVEEDAPNFAEFDLEDVDTNETELEFDITVIGNPGFNGDITLTAEGSKWDDPLSVVIGSVSQPAEIELEERIEVVESIKAHPSGKITITETEKRMFENDDVIALRIEDLDIDDAEISADNGMQVDYKVSDGYLLIQVTRRSNDPATITISDIVFDGSNYIPVGEYSAFIGGQGMHASNTYINFEDSKTSKLIGTVDEDEDGKPEVEDQDLTNDYEEDKEEIFAAAFELEDFVISEKASSTANGNSSSNQTTPSKPYYPPNAAGEDGNYGLPDTDIRISYGSAMVNGRYAYITSEPQIVKGTTMVSVSDLAVLLGIDRDQEYGNTLNYYQSPDGTGHIIIRVGERQLELETGSTRMEIADYNAVNGVYMPQGYLTFTQPAQILYDNENNPRTFVPMRQIGEALGFHVDWDPVTMTAIFTNID